MNELQSTIDNSLVRDIAGLAMMAQEVKRVDDENDQPFIVVPEGHTIESLEHTLAQPSRIVASITMRDAASFIGYVKRHADDGSSIYGQLGMQPKFVAIIDDNEPTDPQWRQHTVSYSCPLSREWATWTGTNNNKKPRSQEEFAQFIEDNLLDIIEPASADILLISRTLEAKKAVNFASAVRLDNGEVQFTYNEEIRGTAGKGQMKVPETFVIAIPVFEGDALYKITARLRYRIKDGDLTIWYDLEREHKTIEAAAKAVWSAIEEATGKTIYNGDPFSK